MDAIFIYISYVRKCMYCCLHKAYTLTTENSLKFDYTSMLRILSRVLRNYRRSKNQNEISDTIMNPLIYI